MRQVRLGRASVLTRVVPESLEPDWNETFAFGEAEVGAAVASGGRLVFEVWDRDYATLDDFMGQACSHGQCDAGAGHKQWHARTRAAATCICWRWSMAKPVHAKWLACW